jgi:CheY-like chemotaxis protein
VRPTRVIYVENDPALRGIMATLLDARDDLDVIGVHADATEALAGSVESGDVALLDLALGSDAMNGVDLGLAMRQRNPPAPTYGTMYGMKRTTVYFPEDLKSRLEAEAKRRNVTEAELIRVAVDKEVRRPRPRGGILTGDLGGLTSENLDEYLEGFGED